MDYHQLLGQVQHRARLGSLEEATRAVRATLQTLGERLFGGEAGNLAAQLPQEIGLYLKEAGPSERFDLDEFYQRVSVREGVDLPAAIFHARVVMGVLAEAVSPGMLANVRAQLPPEFQGLFKAGIQTNPPGQ